MNLSAVGKCQVKHLASGTVTALEEFWRDKNCIIIFFRRWGCMFCRLYAKELSELKPILSKHNVEMVGIGCEDLGSQEFLEGKFFDGELYVDVDRKLYRAMEFKRFNYLSVLASLLWLDSRAAYNKCKKEQISGNLLGDGLQTGGALIVGKGGTLLHEFKQNGPADHIPNSSILEALGLAAEVANLPKGKPTIQPECSDECTR